MHLNFTDYEASRAIPNIVVDGSPNEATVLTLSHWPGSVTPSGLARDLSAEMAFAYLDNPCEHAKAHAVTNNHFDQDGLVSAFALLEPDQAHDHREALIDIARAGDFGTFMHRDSARASTVIAQWYDQGFGYEEALPQLMRLVTDIHHFREIWEAEDEQLAASERALDSGAVTITEVAALDLAIVEIRADEPIRSGHRFAHETFAGMHPMALHNATDCFRLLVLNEGVYRFVDRYETWVTYQSRVPTPRVDMRPLAATLNSLDSTTWIAAGPDALAPILAHRGASTLARESLIDLVTEHLVSA